MSFMPSKTPSQGGLISIQFVFGPEWQAFLKGTEEAKTKFIMDAFDPGLDRLAQFLQNDMTSRMHYLTGAMVSTTEYHKVGPLHYEQNVPVPYAGKENRRPGVKPGFGPHQFWEPAVNTTIQQAMPALVDELIRYIVSHFGGPKM